MVRARLEEALAGVRNSASRGDMMKNGALYVVLERVLEVGKNGV